MSQISAYSYSGILSRKRNLALVYQAFKQQKVCDIRRKNVNRRNISRIAIVSYSEDDMFVFLG